MHEKIKNMRLKKLVGNGIILLFGFILIMGVIALAAAANLSGQTKTLYEKPHSNQVSILKLDAEMAKCGNDVLEIIVSKDSAKITGILEKARDSIKKGNTYFEEIANRGAVKGQANSNLDPVKQLYKNWSDSIEQVLSSIEKGDFNGAAGIYSTQTLEAKEAIEEKVVTISQAMGKNAEKFKVSADKSAMAVFAILTAVTILGAAIAYMVLKSIVNNVTGPIETAVKAASEIEKGNLNYVIEYESENEFGMLMNSMREIMRIVKTYMEDINATLSKMAEGDMTASIEKEYIGDFAPLKVNINRIMEDFHEIIAGLRKTSGEVAAGSAQVAGGSQTLSEGTTEEAGVIEELVATVNEVAEKVEKNAEQAKKAKELSSQTDQYVVEGNDQMELMVEAMKEIQDNTNEIQKIVQNIESIASQTNLLSLNASIEAARAGEQGKGFAVVANEIGNLADESGKATKDTIELINKCMSATRKGAETVNTAAEALQKIVEGTKETEEAVVSIATASAEQSESLRQIVEGIDQVSVVIQSNAEVSEESASASEQLSKQAESMSAIMTRFHIKGDK